MRVSSPLFLRSEFQLGLLGRLRHELYRVEVLELCFSREEVERGATHGLFHVGVDVDDPVLAALVFLNIDELFPI